MVLTVTISINAYRKLMQEEEARCWQTLAESAQLVNQEVTVRIEDNIRLMRLTASALSEDVNSYELFAGQIEQMQELTIFERIDIIYPDRTVWVNGERFDLPFEKDFDELSHRGEYVTTRQADPKTGSQSIYFMIPVVSDGETTAVLSAMINCETLAQYFQPETYGGQAYSAIVDTRDGAFLMDPWHTTLGNAYEMTDRERLDGYEQADPAGAIRNMQTGVTAFVSKTQGVNLYLYYTPVGIYEWEQMLFVPEDVVFAGMISLRRTMLMLGTVELVLLAVYFCWNIVGMRRLMKSQLLAVHQLEISNTLLECVTELSSQQETDDAIRGLLAIIGRYFDGDRSYIYEIEPNSNVICNTYFYSIYPSETKVRLEYFPLDVMRLGWSGFWDKGVLYLKDLSSFEEEGVVRVRKILEERGVESLVVVPLLSQGKAIGFLGVDNPRQHGEDWVILRSLRFFVSSSMETRQRQQELQRMSHTDGLTGLYNRNRYIQETERLERLPMLSHVGVAFLDVNEMKKCNDERGHNAGDQLLQTVARLLQQTFPGQAYRIGGDEFVILSLGRSEEEFDLSLRELLRLAAEQTVSVSCGSVWAAECSSIEALLRQADQRMYSEKARYRQTTKRGR